MNDYDVSVIVDSRLDTNYNYSIKLVTARDLHNTQLLDKFNELNIKVDKEFTGSVSKIVYYTDVSCLVDIKQWLLRLNLILDNLGLKSNLEKIKK